MPRNKQPKKDDNPESRNPTGFQRRSSAGKRRQEDRKLFGGTQYDKDKDKKGK